jgi:hypothetical protein
MQDVPALTSAERAEFIDALEEAQAQIDTNDL